MTLYAHVLRLIIRYCHIIPSAPDLPFAKSIGFTIGLTLSAFMFMYVGLSLRSD